jgi:hypothetical protein
MKSQTSVVESRELQRLLYRQGQTIRSQDFRDQRRIENQLRAWHNRALHNIYGVAKDVLQGLHVEGNSDHVVVSPGLAYDCFGSELLLLKEQKVLFGRQTEPMLLVLRRRQETFVCTAAADVCSPFGASLAAANTELVWLPERGFSFRDGVPLALTIVGLTITLNSAFVVPAARALSRPRIAHGTTIPGATSWKPSSLTLPGISSIVDVQVIIDTSSAGFTTPPEYFATLQGPLTTLDARGAIQSLCIHLDHIEKITIEGFVFRFFALVRVRATFDPVSQIQKFLNQQKAYVSWVGLERVPGKIASEHSGGQP